ncbi:MAG: hypothetical protein U0271_33790 [Polyangiaceae bacterium]
MGEALKSVQRSLLAIAMGLFALGSTGCIVESEETDSEDVAEIEESVEEGVLDDAASDDLNPTDDADDTGETKRVRAVSIETPVVSEGHLGPPSGDESSAGGDDKKDPSPQPWLPATESTPPNDGDPQARAASAALN